MAVLNIIIDHVCLFWKLCDLPRSFFFCVIVDWNVDGVDKKTPPLKFMLIEQRNSCIFPTATLSVAETILASLASVSTGAHGRSCRIS